MPTAALPVPATVDTRKVTNRRTLRFQTTDELRIALDRLADADRAGGPVQLGNWTLGQTLNHLGAWVEYAYAG